MNEMREMDSSMPIILAPERMPRAQLVYGVSPGFYGTVVDAHDDVEGYAMQVVSGAYLSGLAASSGNDEEFFEISVRLRSAGLSPSKDYMRTDTGNLVMIDAGELVVRNEAAYLTFVGAAAPWSSPPAEAGLEEAVADGREQRERLDVGA